MKELKIIDSDRPAIVDDDDYERIVSLNTNWSIMMNESGNKKIYSTRALGITSRSLSLSRFVMKVHMKSFPRVDHINRDTFDNRKENLRFATDTENKWNAKKRSDCTSGFKGVSWHKKSKSWCYGISAHNKRYWKGDFETAKDAAKARDLKAIELHGEFAVLNFPLEVICAN